MKKMGNKGFLLTETLIVSTLLITVMLGLYVQFKNINRKVNNSFNYDSVQSLYKVNEIKKFLEQENFISYINDLEFSNYVDLTDCNSLYFNADSYCRNIVTNAGISTMIITKENLHSIKKDETLDEGLLDYIKTIDYTSSDGYKLIVSFKDGTYANIKIFNSDKYDSIIADSCSAYVSKKYTIAIKDNFGNTITPNITTEVSCGTVVNMEDELENIMASMNADTLNYLNTCFDSTPEYSVDSFVVDGINDNATIIFNKGISTITLSHKANGENIIADSIFYTEYCINTSVRLISASTLRYTIPGYHYVSASIEQFNSNIGEESIVLYYEED